MTHLSSELFWLTLTALWTSVLWVPHILQRIAEMRPQAALRDPLHDPIPQPAWAQRSMRAHANAVENLVVFGAVVLSLEISGTANGMTATAAMVYFFARVAHYFVYTLGLPWLRTPLFALGLTCTMLIGLRVLTG